MRHVPESFSPNVVTEIDRRLAAISADEEVAIPLAVESGSRAWGFPSPDSDYDCRFVFVRPVAQHLSPWPRRDVIETPLDPIFDVNGWDLAKAIKLLLKGNAVIIEWLKSPITYQGDEEFRSSFLALAERLADRAMIGRHYLHLGERQRRVYFSDLQAVALKKVFYAVRPAVALRWMRFRPKAAAPPMHFPTLVEESDLPPDVAACIADLLARKAESHEMGVAPLPAVIGAFIDMEFETAKEAFDVASPRIEESDRRDAETLYRSTVQRYG